MRGFSHIVIVGNLTSDPELRQTGGGKSVAEFPVAVNERYNDQDISHYFDVVVWGAQAENCAQYLTKGSPVLVEGSLRQDRWEAQDGSKRSKVKINARSVTFLATKSEGGGRRQAESNPFAGEDDIPW